MTERRRRVGCEPTTWTSQPHASGRRLHLAVHPDDYVSLGLLGDGDRLAREVFGPLARDEQGTVACALLDRLLLNAPSSSFRRGEDGRLAALGRASAALVRLEAELPGFVHDDRQADVKGALDHLRAALAAALPEGTVVA